MNAFASYYKAYLKNMFQYPLGLLISVFIDPFVVLISISLFTSIYSYGNTSSVAGYDLAQMIWYFAGTNFVWYFTFNFTDWTIAEGILKGDLTLYLLKPTSIFHITFAQALALRTAGVVFEFIPNFIVYALMCHPVFMTPYSFIRFLICILLSLLLMYFLNFLVGLSAFVFKNIQSIYDLKVIVIGLLGGSYFPLDFYPEWLQSILNVLPFKYVFYVPLQVLLNRPGTQTLKDFGTIIGVQIFWISLLFLICHLLWRKAIKYFCAVGG